MSLSAYVNGIGMIGPGFTNWNAAAGVLSGRAGYVEARAVLPTPCLLPSAERRRTGRVVKLALAVALEATEMAGRPAAQLVSVFSSSGGDGQNCHEICQALAQAQREVSPTRFSNSVHNAASGYWSIATGATLASNVLCAFDASFCAGLLDAMAQVVVDGREVLLVAYDTEYPEPLHAKRPIPDAFGVALVLAPRKTRACVAHIEVALSADEEDRMDHASFEAMRLTIPAARCLPLLRQIALRRPGQVMLEYLDVSRVAVQVAPCV